MQDSRLKITKNSKLFVLLKNYKDLKEVQNFDCDIFAVDFSITSENDIEEAKNILKSVLPKITKPLMVRGSGKADIDSKLLPYLIKNLDRKNCIISFATEANYKDIIPYIIEGEHYIVLKTPIDLNLAKELNILSRDLGLYKDRIIMNTDFGGLGYGFEYGYSIMEKVVIEGNKGDIYLNMPLISEAPIESLKTKEARVKNYPQNWGELEDRARMIELSSAAGALSAGANLVVIKYPENMKIMRGLV